jgi:hypothetical protein
MKTKHLFSFLLLTFDFLLAAGQVPQGFNYQAIARNANGVPIASQSVPVRISLVTSLTGGTVIWQEEFPSVTTDVYGLISLVVGNGTRTGGSATSFSAIDWSAQTLFLKTEVKYPGSYWTNMGTSQIWAVPYSMVAKNIAPLSKLGITGTTSDMEEALFEVKNKQGQTVFAVYNEGIRAYVGNGDAKGKKGGFSVGGYDATKGSTIYDLLTLSTDSARLYFDSKITGKGKKGGFSVGGYDMTKGVVQNYLDISKDSVRIYIDNNPLTKGKKGGFAVGGYDMTKGINDNYLNVNTDVSGIINPSQNRILWYPLKNAFLTGKVLVEDKDSVGINSFASGYESKAKGQFSQALGYKAIARGDYSTAIGKNAVTGKINSFAFGDNARALNQDSYAFGAFSEARGIGSFAFGYVGRDSLGPTGKKTIASGDYSFAFGLGSQATGESAFSFGADNEATNNFSMAFGLSTKSTGWFSTTFGQGTVASSVGSFAIGHNTIASNWVATAIGQETVASGPTSFAGGRQSQATNGSTFSYGYSTLASGVESVAMGHKTMSIGSFSFAMGDSAIAGNPWDVALGWRTLANGYYSFAGGRGAKATSYGSFSFGENTLASGQQSVALGNQTIARESSSFAIGYLSQANNWASSAIGSESRANGLISEAFGLGLRANSFTTMVAGRFNDTTNMSNPWSSVATDPVFVIGNGIGDADRKNALTVLQNSNVGINMVNPQQKLDIAQGNGRVQSGFSWLTNSDVRFKKNIYTLEGCLEKVMVMRGVSFDLRNDSLNLEPGRKNIGFIAQELESVIPEVVVTSSDGYKSVAYDKITAVLTEAIKEQQIEIEGQQQQIKNQQKEIDDLKSLNANINK